MQMTMRKGSTTEGCGCGGAAATEADPFAADTFQEDGRIPWSGVLVQEDVETGDGRKIDTGALEWDVADGLPLRWVREDSGRHEDAIRVGTITEIERDGDDILGRGFLLEDVDETVQVLDWLEEGPVGVSVDLDNVSVQWWITLDDGESEVSREEQIDDEGRIKIVDIEAGDELLVITSARIRGATIVDIPAFADAKIELGDVDTDAAAEPETAAADQPVEQVRPTLSVVASGIPVDPPKDWFAYAPKNRPYRMQVERDGRVHGYLLLWNTCHVASPAGGCTPPPKSPTKYRKWFHTHPVLTSEGDIVQTGPMFMTAEHAGGRLDMATAKRVYENTGETAADVVVREDEHGLWVAGAVRPNLTDAQIRELRAAHPSGDWRKREGALELTAALAVTDPGFPVHDDLALVASAHISGDEVVSFRAGWVDDEAAASPCRRGDCPEAGTVDRGKKLRLLDLDRKRF